MEYRGIDVSKWQGTIDWAKVKNSGAEFAIIRVGYGMYENQKDSQFENNYAGCLKNNITGSAANLDTLVGQIVRQRRKASFYRTDDSCRFVIRKTIRIGQISIPGGNDRLAFLH